MSKDSIILESKITRNVSVSSSTVETLSLTSEALRLVSLPSKPETNVLINMVFNLEYR